MYSMLALKLYLKRKCQHIAAELKLKPVENSRFKLSKGQLRK